MLTRRATLPLPLAAFAAAAFAQDKFPSRPVKIINSLAAGSATDVRARVIAGEFILSTSGIGHEIAYAYDNFDNPRMYALILFVLAVVTAFNMTVYAWERRLARRRGTA